MRRLLGVLFGALLLSASACTGGLATAALERFDIVTTTDEEQAGAGPDVVWGVNGHPFTAYDGVSIEQQLDILVRLGLTSYRVNLPGDGAVGGLDRLLIAAKERGVTVLPILMPDISFEKDSPKTIYTLAYRHAESMGRRFAGRIKVWELGNEYENFAILHSCETRDNGEIYSCEHGDAPGDDVLDYHGKRWEKVSAALKGLSEGMKAGDPTALRAMGTAGWGHIGAFERMKHDGIQWDISIWHTYSYGMEGSMQQLQAYGKPIWITEFNEPEGSTHGDHKQAQGMHAMVSELRALRKYGVEQAHVYELLDEPYWSGYESVMGLVRMVKAGAGWKLGPDKPAAGALREAIAGHK